jgi:hypothetical protein
MWPAPCNKTGIISIMHILTTANVHICAILHEVQRTKHASCCTNGSNHVRTWASPADNVAYIFVILPSTQYLESQFKKSGACYPNKHGTLGDKSTMYIRVTVLYITFFSILYCYVTVVYFYYYVMCSFVSLSTLIVMYVPFVCSVSLCCSVYCLCVMCTALLPPGVNQIAAKCIIIIIIFQVLM